MWKTAEEPTRRARGKRESPRSRRPSMRCAGPEAPRRSRKLRRTMRDSRRYLRFSCDLQAEIRYADGMQAARTADISRGGVALVTDQALDVGQRIDVLLTL